MLTFQELMYCRVRIMSYSKSIHICESWCKIFSCCVSSAIFISYIRNFYFFMTEFFKNMLRLLLLVYVVMKFKWVFVVTFFHLIFLLFSQDNTIVYWRKFVAEYYSPRAKKRWCLSLYDNVGHHALGVFPQAAMVIFFLSWWSFLSILKN